MSTYEVVIEGTVLPGFDVAKTHSDLARLTGQSAERVSVLLSGNALPVKRGIDAATAERFVAALRDIGVASYRTQPAASLRLDAGAAISPAVKSTALANTTATVTPPTASPPQSDLSESLPKVPADATSGDQAEVILFEGDVTFLKSSLNAKMGYGVVSNRHFLFQVNGQTLLDIQKSELMSVEEKKHGLSSALVMTLTDQEAVSVQAANHIGMLRALRILAGMEQAPVPKATIDVADATPWYYESDGRRFGPITGAQIKTHCQSNHTVFRHTVVWHDGMAEWTRADKTELAKYFNGPPPLSGDNVKNGTAWLAAFGPLVGTFIAGAIGGFVYGDPDYWSGRKLLYVLLMAIAIMILLAKADQLSLQKAGHNTTALGLGNPAWIPAYLFQRARVFGHSKAYAIVWCVLLGVQGLTMIAI